MRIQSINNYYYPHSNNANRIYATSNTQQYSPVTFTSNLPLGLYNSAIIKYLEHKTYKTSIIGSKRPYFSIPDSLKNIIKPVEIPVNSYEKINGFDINPKNSKKYVIFLHGFSHNITSNMELYKSLMKTDYGILAIDYRSYGHNPFSEHISDKYIMEDVVSAKKYLKKNGIEDVGLIGHSFGAYIASKVTQKEFFNFQIFVSPMTSLKFWYQNVINHPKKYKKDNFLISFLPLFKNAYSKLFKMSKYVNKNDTPTYIIHSKSDKYIQTQYVDNLVKKIPQVKEYKLLPKGGHRMDETKIEAIKNVLLSLN